MGIGTTDDFHEKSCLISLNLSGTITTLLKPVKILLCNNEIAVYSTSNSKHTLYCKDFQYYVIFDKNNIIKLDVDVTDGQVDIFGTMIVTELNLS
ncbi:MAG: hypothetical protein N2485_08595 [bacterium]|nr:hypothetical protein [bacterium]